MFRPLPICIGLRYTRAKRRNHFISFISLASMIGIGLGVMVLITVLSVMNGFDYQIRTKIFSLANQVTVSGEKGSLTDWQTLQTRLSTMQDVKGVAPFVAGQAMMTHEGLVNPVTLVGVLPGEQGHVSALPKKMLEGSINDLVPGKFGILIGDKLASRLDIGVNDKLMVIVPKATFTPIGPIPRYKQFTVVGIFHIGGNLGYDTGVGFLDMQDAQAILKMGKNITGLRLKIDNLLDAPRISAALQTQLGDDYHVTNWTNQFGAFFKAIQMEKTMMFLILLLIIAVATFNLVSSLVMGVNDKAADIAILRTFGASRRMIMAIFMTQGTMIGFIGTLLGLLSGIVLSLNATEIVNWLQGVLHTQFISSSVYYIDFLPSRLEWRDVFHVCGLALIMSFIATIYPAWQAYRTQPAEALRYE